MTDSLVNTTAADDLAPPTGGAPDPLRGEVREVVHGVAKALRAYLLYEGNSPALDRFMESLRGRMVALWDQMRELTLSIEERELHWDGAAVFQSDERENLAFLLYRDGLREITLRPDFEAEELQELLVMLARVQRERGEDHDDLLTLFWERDWTTLRYRYVEALPDGTQIPGASSEERTAIAPPREEVEEQPAAIVSPEDFREALYFLDDTELARLGDELRLEMSRDLWRDVLNALFDRLQDGTPERQAQILGILSELLPTLLGSGRVDLAAFVLGEMVAVATSTRLAPEVLRGVRGLFDQLAEAETVGELVRVVEHSGDKVRDDDLSTLLAFFPPAALAPLLGAAEASASDRVRRAVQSAAERLAGANPDHLVGLAGDASASVAAGAARLLGRLRIAAGAGAVSRLLTRPEAAIRVVAVEALAEMRTPTGAGALESALEDPDRDVRVAAAKALAAIRYAPARVKLEGMLEKRLRDPKGAELSERIAFFESYGGLAGAEGVPLLEKMLNGKSWLGRRDSAEIRACAALGLGRIKHPSAEKALNQAAADPDPVVRSAVGRALRSVRQ
jgi:HEAT repeat protein